MASASRLCRPAVHFHCSVHHLVLVLLLHAPLLQCVLTCLTCFRQFLLRVTVSWLGCMVFFSMLQVRSYLRHRAGLPPIVAGSSALNQGNRSLFERELLLLHDILLKDNDVHDDLQLLDGRNSDRHLIIRVAVPPSVPVVPRAEVLEPAAARAPSVPSGVGAAPRGVVLPVPSQAMRLEPLPSDFTGRGASHSRENNLTPVVRHGERADDYDEEEDEEIRPVSDSRAAQWRAYRATGF